MTRNVKNAIYIMMIGITCFIISCKIIDPPETIPSYIKISTITVKTPSDNSQGSGSSKIADGWITMDGNIQGVYPLPAKFPVLKTGLETVRVRAGILISGVAATRYDYPFYNNYDTTITLNEKKVTEIKPVIPGYKSGTVFHWMEDFEGSGSSLVRSNNSGNDMTTTNDASVVYEGAACGKFQILPNTYNVQIETSLSYVLPKQGLDVYLEVNYNINQKMQIGIFGISPSQVTQTSLVGLRPTIDSNGKSYWNKVYVNLSDQVSAITAATTYKVYFAAVYDTTVATPTFLIDNIKLVSF